MHPIPTPHARQQLYSDMAPLHLTPLWEVLHALVPREPQTPCVPALWRYDEMRPFLMRVGQADHRRGSGAPRAGPGEPGAARPVVDHAVALCRAAADPAGRGGAQRTATRSRRCASSSKARAPTPRWTASAPRCARATSSSRRRWTWHDHGNEGRAARWCGSTAWTSRWSASSMPASPRTTQRPLAAGHARPKAQPARFGHNMVPVRHDRRSARPRRSSATPTSAAARRCDQLRARRARSTPGTAYKLRYVNPLTGGSPMPTIGDLPADAAGRLRRQGAWRQTDGAVYSVVEGHGTVASNAAAAVRFELRAARHLRRAVVAPARLRSPARLRAVQLLRPAGAAGAGHPPSRRKVVMSYVIPPPPARVVACPSSAAPSASRCAASTASAATTSSTPGRWASTGPRAALLLLQAGRRARWSGARGRDRHASPTRA